MTAFAQKRIDVTFALGTGPQGQAKSFTQTGADTLTLRGLRVRANISKTGMPSADFLSMVVWGMTLSNMNQLSTLGQYGQIITNSVVAIAAGDDESGMSQVFRGNIIQAWVDFNGAPDVALHVEAQGGLLARTVTVMPQSFPGSADAAQVLSNIASQMGLTLENSGVTGKLPSPYLWGSAGDQLKQVLETANGAIEAEVDQAAGVLAVWPKNGKRNGAVPILSPATGLVSYPGYSNFLILLKTLYNPSIRLGGEVEVRSSLKPASRRWRVSSLEHSLAANMPHGTWFSHMIGTDPLAPQPVPRAVGK